MSDFESRYERLHPLGQPGGFGTVYKAKDRILDDIVAVKILNPQLHTEPQITAMFRDEAILTRKLKHANIVQVLEYDEKHYAIVMEYIHGVTLSHFIRVHQQQKGFIPPERLGLYIVGEVCRALHYAHFAEEVEASGRRRPLNIIHRDVSPSNIMITGEGGVKMIDFGIAKAEFQARRSGRTRTGVVKGKPYYLSPEHGNPAKMDHRSDIFPLGAVLFEVLTGQKLFDNVYSTVIDMKEVVIPPDKFESNHLRWEIERIIRKAAEHERERRYQTAADMHKDIEDDLSRIGAKPADLQRQLREVMQNFPLEVSGENTEPATPPTQDFHPIVELPPTPVVLASSPAPEIKREPEPISRTAPKPRMRATAAPFFERLRKKISGLSLPKIPRKVLATAALICVAVIAMRFFMPSTPTLTVASTPGGAQVFLNGEALPGVTPVKIKSFKAGLQQLRLSLPGFDDLQNTITIVDTNNSAAFHFTFQARVRVQANLPNAIVLLNGRPLENRTPTEFRWEVDKEFELGLAQAGFDTLRGFRYRGLDNRNAPDLDVAHEAAWRFTSLAEGAAAWQIEGLFYKTLHVKSLPPGAEIFVDGDFSAPAGIADQDEITLPAGEHRLTLRSTEKKLVDWTHHITVDGKLKPELTLSLYRKIRLTAAPATARAEVANITGSSARLDSAIVMTTRGTRQRLFLRGQRQFETFIPLSVELFLPMGTHRILVAAPGYLDQEVTLPADKTGDLVVNLQRRTATGVEIYVYDAQSKVPLLGARVSYCKFHRRSSECITTYGFSGQPFGTLDSYGSHARELEPGNYYFKAEYEGYEAGSQEESVSAQRRQIRIGLKR